MVNSQISQPLLRLQQDCFVIDHALAAAEVGRERHTRGADAPDMEVVNPANPFDGQQGRFNRIEVHGAGHRIEGQGAGFQQERYLSAFLSRLHALAEHVTTPYPDSVAQGARGS